MELPPATITIDDAVEIDIFTARFTVSSNVHTPIFTMSTPYVGRFSDNGFLLLANTAVNITFYGWEESKFFFLK